MAHDPLERREAVVRRMLGEGISIAEIARDTGISEGTPCIAGGRPPRQRKTM